MGNARPYFECGIDEMLEAAEDPNEREAIKQELAFRRPTKKVRALAKTLRCETKSRPSLGAPNPFEGAVVQFEYDPSAGGVL